MSEFLVERNAAPRLQHVQGRAIYQRSLDQGMEPYRGDGELGYATLYFWAAARLCAGWALVVLSAIGGILAVWKRHWWPLVLLSLPPVFYIWSIYSSGTPIFVPDLWPNAWYNTRYGLAALPLLVVAAATIVAMAPGRLRLVATLGVALAALGPWWYTPDPESWICWKEARVNSEQRRAWTSEAAGYLRRYYRGGGVLASFGDLTGILLEAGIPLRETVHSGNAPNWHGSMARPDLFLREEWAVAFSGDEVATAILRAHKDGPRYDRVKMIAVRGGPVVEIYRRNHEDPVLETPRRR